MTERGAMTVFLAGLILTMAGVGGVENSVETAEFASSCLVAALGLLAMYAATLGFRNSNNG